MRIGFSGAHGTGKTTLLKGMIGWEELSGHHFVSGLTRKNANKGIPINQNGTFEGQKALMKSLAWTVRQHSDLVIDRTLLDIYSYTVHHRDHDLLTSQELNYIRTQSRKVQPLFDIVFYIRPEFEVTADTVRVEDPGFQIEIAAELEYTIMNHVFDIPWLVILSGDVEERLDKVRETLEDYASKVRREQASRAVEANQIVGV